ncbi:hypothetical protein Tco_1045420 [Tanacetum coccineum]|uniref:Uncharacterized protein n=1 Tax=Tanacetum coccineum TaxID=301880 RepID=A0ABQ5GSU5_9ASTR
MTLTAITFGAWSLLINLIYSCPSHGSSIALPLVIGLIFTVDVSPIASIVISLIALIVPIATTITFRLKTFPLLPSSAARAFSYPY